MQKAATVIYHADCQDGFAAAFIAVNALESYNYVVKCISANYGDDIPLEEDLKGREVMVLDFSYSEEQLRAIVALADALTVLDHHEASREKIQNLLSEGTILGEWDNTRSGAGIAWDYFHAGESRPVLIDYIEDRDIAAKKFIDSEDVYLAVSSYPKTFTAWGDLMRRPIREVINEGHLLSRKRYQDMADIIRRNQVRLVIGDYNVPAVNAPYEMATALGGLLCDSEPFSAVYSFGVTGIKFSLRSHNEYGADVNVIAARFGGGGHIHAAGFTVPHHSLTFEGGVAYLSGIEKDKAESIAA